MSIRTHLALVHRQTANVLFVLNRPEIGVANGVTIIGRCDRGGHQAIAILAEVDSYRNIGAIETRMSFLSLIPTYQPESSLIIDKLS